VLSNESYNNTLELHVLISTFSMISVVAHLSRASPRISACDTRPLFLAWYFHPQFSPVTNHVHKVSGTVGPSHMITLIASNQQW